jgi:hypothetical protein
MEPASSIEDWRGVDVGQIRRLLSMTVAERAAEMVRVSNRLFRAQQRVLRDRDERTRRV